MCAYTFKNSLKKHDFRIKEDPEAAVGNNPTEQKWCERTFITVHNDPNNVAFNKIFNMKPRRNYPRKLKCVISK